ncbi:MAG: hypothetical protein HY329_27735, partial [Chloroflexi bacterium]|nr:hypothetical protein [Chloroflexota bacterium]
MKATEISESELRQPGATLDFRRTLQRRRLGGWLHWASRRDNLPLTIGMFVVGLFAFFALFADLISPYGADDKAILFRLKPPVWLAGGEWAHPLGTDELGRDMLARL